MKSLFDVIMLGNLIDYLGSAPYWNEVYFDFGMCIPGKLGSYRGFYEDLAIGWSSEAEPVTVGVLHANLKSAIGSVYQAYKGGNYLAFSDTRVWASNYGKVSNTGIVSLEDAGWATILKTDFIHV